MAYILTRSSLIRTIETYSPLQCVAAQLYPRSISTSHPLLSLSSSSTINSTTSSSSSTSVPLPYIYDTLTQNNQPFLPIQPSTVPISPSGISDPKLKFTSLFNTTTSTTSPSTSHSTTQPISWYTCGPTVYDSAHLGHARTYMIFDILQRITETYIYPNRKLLSVMNITDIDDKIINRSKLVQIYPMELTKKYEEEFWTNLQQLYIRKPIVTPRVTDHIPDIIEYIKMILNNKLAYILDDGVYLDTNKLGTIYGKMAPINNTSNNDDNDNTLNNPTIPSRNKRNPKDFALWKSYIPDTTTSTNNNKYDVYFWNSPWGKGRPGWHIECTSMIYSIFGNKLDIHAGGIDLAFPHHCNECAQADAYMNLSSSTWVQHWLHSGHMYIQGSKMSKSLKNFITIQEFLNNNNPNIQITLPSDISLSDAYRMYIFQYHYRSNITFTPTIIQDAGLMIKKIKNVLNMIFARLENTKTDTAINTNPRWRNEEFQLLTIFLQNHQSIVHHYSSDFNTPSVIKILQDINTLLVQYISSNTNIHYDTLVWCLNTYLQYYEVIGFQFIHEYQYRLQNLQYTKNNTKNDIPLSSSISSINEPAIQALVTFRDTIRKDTITISKELKILSKFMNTNNNDPRSNFINTKEKNTINNNNNDLNNNVDNIRKQITKVLETCDEIRDKTIPTLGYELKDSAQGSILTKK